MKKFTWIGDSGDHQQNIVGVEDIPKSFNNSSKWTPFMDTARSSKSFDVMNHVWVTLNARVPG